MKLLSTLLLVVTMLMTTNGLATSYAILGFDAGEELSRGVASELANQLEILLASNEDNTIIPQAETHRILRQNGIVSSSYDSALEYVRAVGTQTKADIVLYGWIKPDEGGHRVNAYLFGAAADKVIKRSTSLVDAPPDMFAAQAADNAVTGLGLAPSMAEQVTAEPLVTSTLSSASSETESVIPESVLKLYDSFIIDHLSIGLRFSHFTFTDPSKKTYDDEGNLTGGYTYGISTYDLEERQSYDPTLYLIYAFTPYVALQIGWEEIEGRAWTLDTADPHYDGDMILSGPSVVLQVRYDNKTILTPYLGIGIAMLEGDFEEEDSWSAGGFRNMTAADTTGYIFAVGTSVSAYKHVEIDLSFSYMRAESDARYYLRGEGHDRSTWTWPADATIAQIGLRYAF